MTMVPEYKTKWLEALRSGNFKQGQYRLKSALDDQYCCLGVLADVCGVVWLAAKEGQDKHGQFPYKNGELVTTSENDNGYLSNTILGLVGLSDGDQRLLANKNDEEGADFEVIANYIEKNL